QANLETLGSIDNLAVHRNLAIGDAHNQLALDQAFDIRLVDYFFVAGQYFAGKAHIAATQRTTLARIAAPAQIKTDQLPHRVEPQTTRHDRISFEMIGKKPEVGMNVEFGQYSALAVAAA